MSNDEHDRKVFVSFQFDAVEFAARAAGAVQVSGRAAGSSSAHARIEAIGPIEDIIETADAEPPQYWIETFRSEGLVERRSLDGTTIELRWESGKGPMQDTAERVFGFVASICPTRVYNEDMGDFLEKIAALERRGAPRWRCWCSIVAGLACVGLNVLREIRAAWQGKKT